MATISTILPGFPNPNSVDLTGSPISTILPGIGVDQPSTTTPIYFDMVAGAFITPLTRSLFKALDNSAATPGATTQPPITNYVSQWLGQSDVIRLPPNRRIDDLSAPVGVPKGEFLPTFASQWHNSDFPARFAPIRPIDALSPSFGQPKPVPMVAQWFIQTDIRPLPLPHPLDNPAAPLTVPAGMFVSTYISQWNNDGSVPKPIRFLSPEDNLTAPVTIAKGEFLTTYVSQWIGQTDTSHLPPPRPIDDVRNPPAIATGQFLSSFVSQWMPPDPVAKLPLPRFADITVPTFWGPYVQVLQARERAKTGVGL